MVARPAPRRVCRHAKSEQRRGLGVVVSGVPHHEARRCGCVVDGQLRGLRGGSTTAVGGAFGAVTGGFQRVVPLVGRASRSGRALFHGPKPSMKERTYPGTQSSGGRLFPCSPGWFFWLFPICPPLVWNEARQLGHRTAYVQGKASKSQNRFPSSRERRDPVAADRNIQRPLPRSTPPCAPRGSEPDRC